MSPRQHHFDRPHVSPCVAHVSLLVALLSLCTIEIQGPDGECAMRRRGECDVLFAKTKLEPGGKRTGPRAPAATRGWLVDCRSDGVESHEMRIRLSSFP